MMGMQLVTALEEITPAIDSKFPFGGVAIPFHAGIECIYLLDIPNDHQYVNDGFRLHPRNGRAADMMNGDRFPLKYFL